MGLSEELQALFVEDWLFEMKDNPEFASQAGAHDIEFTNEEEGFFYLQDVSPKGYAKRMAHSEDMLVRIEDIVLENDARRYRRDELRKLSLEEREAVLSTSSFKEMWIADQDPELLSETEIIQARIFRAMHQENASMIASSKMYLMPINSMGVGGVTFSFMENVEMMRFECTKDFEVYLLRLKAFHIQVDQFLESLKEGLKFNMISSHAMCRRVEEQLEEVISSDMTMLKAPISPPSEANKLQNTIEELSREWDDKCRIYELAHKKALDTERSSDHKVTFLHGY